MANWNTIDELRQIFINKYITTQLQAELKKACSEEYELKRDIMVDKFWNYFKMLMTCIVKQKRWQSR